MSFTSLDLLILAALLAGLVRGLFTGAVRQIIGFVGLVISIVLAVETMGTVGQALSQLTGLGDSIAQVIGFILVFVVIRIVLIYLAKFVEAGIKALRMGLLNRLTGAVVGACKAALLVSILLFTMEFFDFPGQNARESSVLYVPVISVFPAAWNYAARWLPRARELSDRFGQEVEEVIDERFP